MGTPTWRRMLGTAAAGILVVALVAAPVGANGLGRDQVNGEGYFQSVNAHVNINAHGSPETNEARGRFRLEQGGFVYEGTVTCLRIVEGNTAVAGGPLTSSNNMSRPVGSGFVQTTVDNGPGEVDASLTTFTSAPPSDCTSLAPVGSLLSMTEGNYTVRPGANGR
jgi:hypothetical protein